MGAPNVKQATENANARMKGDDIARRLLRFGLDVLCFMRQLPGDYVGRHIGRQLVRAATAGGANYEESRSAESCADFAHKVSIAASTLSPFRPRPAHSRSCSLFPVSTFRSAHEMSFHY